MSYGALFTGSSEANTESEFLDSCSYSLNDFVTLGILIKYLFIILTHLVWSISRIRFTWSYSLNF